MNPLDLMDMALEKSWDCMGTTSPNPAVGAVIAKNGNIVSIGGTCSFGSDHAEVVALKGAVSAIGEDLRGCEIFVTLEPCSHFGKTPPCADAIIRSGIERVYIPILDPNPLVAGRGVKRLRDSGVDVVILKERAESATDLIRPFRKYILEKKPFVLNKSAVTLDGRTATSAGDSRWISSEYSRYLVHRLRTKVDAIIIGRNTLVNDNPSLNVRLSSFEERVSGYFREGNITLMGRDNYFMNSLIRREAATVRDPLRVAIGIPESIDHGWNFFRDDNYLVIENELNHKKIMDTHPEKRQFIDSMNLALIEETDPLEQAESIMRELYDRGVMFALLEGGGRLSGSFLDSGNIDQFMYFIAPKVAGDGLPPLKEGDRS